MHIQSLYRAYTQFTRSSRKADTELSFARCSKSVEFWLAQSLITYFFGGGLPGASLDLLAHATLTQSRYKAYKAYTKLIQSKAYTKLTQSLYKAYTKLIQSTCKAYTKRIQSLRKAYTKLMQSLHKAYTKLNFNRIEKTHLMIINLFAFGCPGSPGTFWSTQSLLKLMQSLPKAYTKLIQSVYLRLRKARTKLIQCSYEAHTKLMHAKSTRSFHKPFTKLIRSLYMQSLYKAYTKLIWGL